MFSLCYNLFAHLFAAWVSCKTLARHPFKAKSWKIVKSYFGYHFPNIQKGKKRLIWIHAVSVGELKAIAPLATSLQERYPNDIFLISTITETGLEEARRSLPNAHYHVRLPLDLPWIIDPITTHLKADLLLLSETDFWYNLQKGVQSHGGHVAVVNGKLSLRSLRRYQKFPIVARHIFSTVDLFCLQGATYQERFLSLGVPSSKMHLAGNMKLDSSFPERSPEEVKRLRKLWAIQEGQPVLVIGSSHDPEEKLFLSILQEVWKQLPELKVILVPRHPERFDVVATLLAKHRIPFARHSQLNDQTGQEPCLLIDAMGLLRSCYQLATIALVAGSFTKAVGGHNILEPSWYGVPVIFGPYMDSQPDFTLLMNEYKAGIQVEPSLLAETILKLCRDIRLRERLGSSGKKIFLDHRGATLRTLQWVDLLIKN